jgi:PelA/Pel-15E family pectate lyase
MKINYFLKIVPRSSFILLTILFITVTLAQKKASAKKYKSIDISEFMDSAHHWYDLVGDDRVIEALQNKPRYKPDEITKIADNILLYQKVNGGWPKNYDMLAILTDEQKEALKKSVADTNSTTFDNGATHSQIDYLAKVYTITNSEKYKTAILKGIDFILSAQYANGGWPQFYPAPHGYAKHITFNDGAIIGIMKIMLKVIENNSDYLFVDDAHKEKISKEFNKGLECILKCQIKENDKLLVWCQQHDELNFQPQWARAFEPPSICNDESAGIVLFLMSMQNPSKEIINSIQSAVRWFSDSKILGIRVKTVSAPTVKFPYRTSSTDRVVVEDSKATQIWTRYYELATHRPMFCNRDSKPVYSLAEVERERRDGYGWYTYAPQEVLDKYSEWQKKCDPNQNVLN